MTRLFPKTYDPSRKNNSPQNETDTQAKGGGRHFSKTYAAKDLHHKGGKEEGGAWSADQDNGVIDHIVYGPYAKDIPAGANKVNFELAVETIASGEKVCIIDVCDASEGVKTLTSKVITTNDFAAAMSFTPLP